MRGVLAPGCEGPAFSRPVEERVVWLIFLAFLLYSMVSVGFSRRLILSCLVKLLTLYFCRQALAAVA